MVLKIKVRVTSVHQGPLSNTVTVLRQPLVYWNPGLKFHYSIGRETVVPSTTPTSLCGLFDQNASQTPEKGVLTASA